MTYGAISSILTPAKKQLYLFFYVRRRENELIMQFPGTASPVSLLTSGGRVYSPICGAGAVEYM